MSDLEALVKELGDQVLAVYQSPEAVEQRLLFGQNVFRVFDGGRLHVLPYKDWPNAETGARRFHIKL